MGAACQSSVSWELFVSRSESTHFDHQLFPNILWFKFSLGDKDMTWDMLLREVCKMSPALSLWRNNLIWLKFPGPWLIALSMHLAIIEHLLCASQWINLQKLIKEQTHRILIWCDEDDRDMHGAYGGTDEETLPHRSFKANHGRAFSVWLCLTLLHTWLILVCVMAFKIIIYAMRNLFSHRMGLQG